MLWGRARPTKDERLIDESDALLREGLAVAARGPGQYTNDRAILSINYAHHLRDRGHVEESLQYFDLAVRILESMPEMKQVLPSASFYALYTRNREISPKQSNGIARLLRWTPLSP